MTPLLAVVAAAALLTAACDSASAGPSAGSLPPSGTVGGVGVLPAEVDAAVEPVVAVRPPTDPEGNPVDLLADEVDGNHVLLIGDSIFTSISPRYGGHACKALVPLGWQVQVEAEPSRFIEFGNRVLDRMLDGQQEWNAAVVFLGSNYNGDAAGYERQLSRIIERLAPRPTVVLTVTEYRPNYVDVNEAIERLAAEHDNVTVLDWNSIAQTPGVLSGDRLHPSDRGRDVLAESIAATLGPVTVGDGKCLPSQFSDDSAVGGDADADTVLGRPTTTLRGSSRPSTTQSPTTTSAPATPTTTTALNPSNTTDQSGGGGDGESGAGERTTDGGSELSDTDP